ncbi:MAG: iron-containing alcohol dehydrogenase [Desulfobacteraceae bacterium]|nr:iron-containing alcohol dehydrogenase [Desulfobacteraceae bacterium]
MLGSFRVRTPDWILFGFDTVRQVGAEARRLGAGRVMLLTDPGVAKAGLLDPVYESLKGEGLEYDIFDTVEPEPSIQNLLEASKMAKEGKFDVFVAVGGGSSMDTTKVVSAMMTNEGDIQDFFGVDNVPRRGLPTIMVTTTSGTGSEVTRMAVFTDKAVNLKRVVSAQNILADVAIVDPNLTVSMPQAVTAATGIDAFIHAVEAYVAVSASPLTDTIALEATKLVAENLGPAFANGNDMTARYNMALGSFMAGISLNNAGVGAVHALAYPIGAEYHLSHGLALIVIFAETMRSISISCLPKFRKLAEAMGVDVQGLTPWEAADEAVAGMSELAKMVGLPTTLSEVGGDQTKIAKWAKAAHGEQRLLGNTPRTLSVEDVADIFKKSF